jgi:hypothetical protein
MVSPVVIHLSTAFLVVPLVMFGVLLTRGHFPSYRSTQSVCELVSSPRLHITTLAVGNTFRRTGQNMMTLYNPALSDKFTAHTYLAVYRHLFATKRYRARHVAEIGINTGGSILIWHGYFPNAVIHGLDIAGTPPALVHLNATSPRLALHVHQDAYLPENIAANFISQGIKFDVLIDDGPHTYASMASAIRLYLPQMSDDGIFVIEDVQHIEWTRELRKLLSPEDQRFLHILNLRENKNRGDDIMFIVNRETY